MEMVYNVDLSCSSSNSVLNRRRSAYHSYIRTENSDECSQESSRQITRLTLVQSLYSGCFCSALLSCSVEGVSFPSTVFYDRIKLQNNYRLIPDLLMIQNIYITALSKRSSLQY